MRWYPRERPKRINGIKAKGRRGDIGETWWSKRWIKVLETFEERERMNRGRSYARSGQVISVKVKKGVIYARVQGTQPRPYSVKIALPQFPDVIWGKVIDVMSSQALFAAKLLSGEMPRTIENVFNSMNLSLFPLPEEFDMSCSCPDWAIPCKHIAAVYYLLAEEFDEDPFLIFKLRGRTKEEITKMLRERRTNLSGKVWEEESDVPTEERVRTFWGLGGPLDFAMSFTVPEENVILKRLGDAPFTVGDQNMTHWLSKAYAVVSTAALEMVEE